MMVVEISAAVVACAFAVLVFFAVRTMIAARESLKQAHDSIHQIQRELAETSLELNKLLRSTQSITTDIQGKLEKTDPFFNSANQVGEAVQEVTKSVKQVSASLSQGVMGVEQTLRSRQQQWANVVDWAAAGIQLWQVWKAHRQDQSVKAQAQTTKQGDEKDVG
ncbi:MAG: hypothetical protein K0R75_1529 [Paenibacillaceae bacterium]|jgi:uncharacterized protein YoxC|nr:hypothetical protein [Paenibacillaceae bacterium]